MKSHKLQQGFTIIETLVAITILMISIAGPLTIAHKGLLASTDAHNQITASYLAQDAIEFIKNIRDNNRIDGADYLRGLDLCTSVTSTCGVDTYLGDPADSGSLMGVKPCSVNTCVLLKAPGGGYTHSVTIAQGFTPFTRYFYITPRSGNQQDEAGLTVIVTWRSGLIENQVTFENELFNVLR